MIPVLLPLYQHPAVDPAAWAVAGSGGRGVTVAVDGSFRDPAFVAALRELRAGGVTVLGRVDAGFAARPVADLFDEVAGWAGYPVDGVLLDQAPTSPFSLGPVAMAIRLAHRSGLPRVVLNPGLPPDPRYRGLGAAVCAFHGSWWEYQRWDADGARPGDGHLVHSVPPEEFDAAWELLRQRGAGFGLVTDRTPPEPYAGLPSWLSEPAWHGDAADTAGTSTRNGC